MHLDTADDLRANRLYWGLLESFSRLLQAQEVAPVSAWFERRYYFRRIVIKEPVRQVCGFGRRFTIRARLEVVAASATGATTVFAQSVGKTIAPAVYGGANVPAGITATALLTVVPTNGSGQIKVCSVRGREVGLVLSQAYTVTGSVPNQIVNASAITPANAIEVFGELQFGSSVLSALSLTVNSDIGLVCQQIGSATLGAGNTDVRNYSGLTIDSPQ